MGRVAFVLFCVAMLRSVQFIMKMTDSNHHSSLVLPLQIVVNSLVHAVPAIVNVMLVCLIFWLIFSIVGYQLFSGKFFRCVNNKTLEMIDWHLVKTKDQCNETAGMRWMNAKINFDNSLQGFLALFQVVRINFVTFKAGLTDRESGREVGFASTSLALFTPDINR